MFVITVFDLLPATFINEAMGASVFLQMTDVRF